MTDRDLRPAIQLLLAQVEADRAHPFWGAERDRRDMLDSVESWLVSLRGWFDATLGREGEA